MDSISLEAEYGDLVIHDVEETGVELGRGSYSVVFEVKWRGKMRAAKKLHDFFFEPELRELPGSQKEIMNFKREFRSWVKLDHPNMVHLLGLYYNPARSTRSPIIVMEKMDISLGDYLEKKTRSTFPLQQKACILLQVAEGLSYLHGHTPPLVHHDLKPDNVMLDTNTFTAKLTDFGMIRVTTPGNLARASSMKGTPVFMPPEAKEIPLRYDEQLDVFSFGVVIISTLVHNKAPTPSAARVSQGGRLVAVSELDQRRKYIDQFTVEERRLFMPMVGQCLEFVPEMRPRSSQLVDSLSSINASLQSTISPGAAAVHPLTQRLSSLSVGQASSADIESRTEAAFGKAEGLPEPSTSSATEIEMLKQEVARRKKQCSRAEEQRKRHEDCHLRLIRLYGENESLNWKGEEAKGSYSEPDHQLVQIDQAALCKKCRKRLQEKKILSANSTVVRYVYVCRSARMLDDVTVQSSPPVN